MRSRTRLLSRVEERKAREVFDQLRRDFFPGWEDGAQWTVRLGIAPGLVAGFPNSSCEWETKTIWVRKQRRTRLWVELIVREICSAIAEDDEARWAELMRAFANRAESLGRTKLAWQVAMQVFESVEYYEVIAAEASEAAAQAVES